MNGYDTNGNGPQQPTPAQQPPQAPPAQQGGAPSAQPTQVYGGWEVPPTGGSKAAWFALGFFLGLIGVLIAYLLAKDKGPLNKSAALKFSLFGTGALVLITILSTMVTFCGAAAMYAYY